MVVYTVMVLLFFFCKQKTAYEVRISDWSSDVCSSDLLPADAGRKCLSANSVGSDFATCRLHRCAGARLAVGGGNRRHPRIGCRGGAVVLCRPLDRHRTIEALCFPPRPMADVDAR